MPSVTYNQMLEAGVHFGHLRKKWNPKMAPYIFMEKKGIHIIDLNKTGTSLEQAGNAVRSIARSGRKILFVATKKQAKDLVKESAIRCNMPYVTERWLGGMLTNFATIRKSVKKMQSIDRMLGEENITKKEKLMLAREKQKMERVIGGIANINRIPNAIFIVDIAFEHIAVAEATKLGLKTFGMVDTNSDPTSIDFPIPANDDASKSIELITKFMTDCIIEGLEERKSSQKDAPKQDREFKSEGGGDGGNESARKPRRTRTKRSEGTDKVETEKAKPETKPEVKPEAKAEVKAEVKAEESESAE